MYVDGDNRPCLATDTMKNTVYALARQDAIEHVETFGLRLAGYFADKPGVSRVRIAASEHRWDRLSANGRPHPHAFGDAGADEWTAVITHDADGTVVRSGLTNLVVLKTTDSAFSGFPRDEYTTLPETEDRILAISMTAAWTYRRGVTDFTARERLRTALVETFAAHPSRRRPAHLLCDGRGRAGQVRRRDRDHAHGRQPAPPPRHSRPFKLDNPNDVFVATDQPFGLIEATIRRQS